MPRLDESKPMVTRLGNDPDGIKYVQDDVAYDNQKRAIGKRKTDGTFELYKKSPAVQPDKPTKTPSPDETEGGSGDGSTGEQNDNNTGDTTTGDENTGDSSDGGDLGAQVEIGADVETDLKLFSDATLDEMDRDALLGYGRETLKMENLKGNSSAAALRIQIKEHHAQLREAE